MLCPVLATHRKSKCAFKLEAERSSVAERSAFFLDMGKSSLDMVMHEQTLTWTNLHRVKYLLVSLTHGLEMTIASEDRLRWVGQLGLRVSLQPCWHTVLN